ncbi:histidine-rich glycoprotein [Culex quinquefasciatus]|uniref:histidine-rich glycoprotein n=1 Tax=Culex quinquefasciatus TaxID=7176 RepID=UPI0018E38EFA|nr:histidine-rich glycoprotein [Culex quinquefasciatus]
MIKVACILLFVAVTATAGGFHQEHHQPEHHHEEHHEDHHAHPKYKFEYGVKDHKTGDHKSHWEERDGDVVKGQYTLHEADGTERVVKYTADHHNGFNAVVETVGHPVHHEHHHEPQHHHVDHHPVHEHHHHEKHHQQRSGHYDHAESYSKLSRYD